MVYYKDLNSQSWLFSRSLLLSEELLPNINEVTKMKSIFIVLVVLGLALAKPFDFDDLEFFEDPKGKFSRELLLMTSEF